jgi:hypothetical protein
LLLVAQANAIVDRRERSTVCEVRPGRRPVVETDEQRAGVSGEWLSPFAESVVAAVGMRELEGGAEHVDRARLAVIEQSGYLEQSSDLGPAEAHHDVVAVGVRAFMSAHD